MPTLCLQIFHIIYLVKPVKFKSQHGYKTANGNNQQKIIPIVEVEIVKDGINQNAHQAGESENADKKFHVSLI